ncbi:hypothetical protein HYC85_029839 [Camellia sinensis]|uniref:Uncharacterized protein n=1 Tax=Camellia sinensis TaxID=4442 RepID=A0A7J7G1P4_CAMSI|nr:hypothetical protein HYC85_029839 [Camellia sinensis]
MGLLFSTLSPSDASEVKSFRTKREVDQWLFSNPMQCSGAHHFVERNATVISYGLQTNSTPVGKQEHFEDPTFKFQIPLQIAAEREIASSLIMEKELKLRQAMTMMGLYDTAYWFTWLTWEGIYRHPICDSPQDLDVISVSLRGMHVSARKSEYQARGHQYLVESVLPEGISLQAEFWAEFSREHGHSVLLISVLLQKGLISLGYSGPVLLCDQGMNHLQAALSLLRMWRMARTVLSICEC